MARLSLRQQLFFADARLQLPGPADKPCDHQTGRLRLPSVGRRKKSSHQLVMETWSCEDRGAPQMLNAQMLKCSYRNRPGQSCTPATRRRFAPTRSRPRLRRPPPPSCCQALERVDCGRTEAAGAQGICTEQVCLELLQQCDRDTEQHIGPVDEHPVPDEVGGAARQDT